MKAQTRVFGTVDIADDKIITMEKGMIGFPNLKHFALIFDEEKKNDKGFIMWFQSMDDGDIAFPVMDPNKVMDDYTPSVNNELLSGLGEMTMENTFLLVTVTVPKQIENFSVNLKAPIVINTDTQKGAQVITESDYPVKYKVYEILKARREKDGE